MRDVLYTLGSLADSDIEWMIAAGQVRVLAAGEVLIEERKPLDSLYLLLTGALAVTVTQNGKVLARVGPGEVLGEISMLDSRPPVATVRATTESHLLRIPTDRLSRKLESDQGFAARFYRALAVFLAQRMRRTTELLGDKSKSQLDEDVESADEIDPELLDEVSLAGKRFEWILSRVKGRS